ncbi:hypothetical protein CRG98_033099, partial [Punica granatum]
MAAPALLSPPRASPATISRHLPCRAPKTEKWNKCRLRSPELRWVSSDSTSGSSPRLPKSPFTTMCSKDASISPDTFEGKKRVWIWTENKQVMTAAVERGWNTFLFTRPELADDWSSIAMIQPLFIKDGLLVDGEEKTVATIIEVSTAEGLQRLHPEDGQPQNIVLDLLDWQVIPAENIVATFQGSQKTVFAISKTPTEARTFLEALEQGLGGVVLKAQDTEAVIDLK